MPVYEFYCPDCHTIYSFFSRRINTERVPGCPSEVCTGNSLKKQVSLFSISKGREEDDASDPLSGIDDSRLEQAMMSMAGEMENLDEDDPKQAARVMRKLFNSTGLKLGGGIEEAISRMEAGEDPEQIEAELGDALDDDELFSTKPRKLMDDLRRKYLPPKVDDTLYEL